MSTHTPRSPRPFTIRTAVGEDDDGVDPVLVVILVVVQDVVIQDGTDVVTWITTLTGTYSEI